MLNKDKIEAKYRMAYYIFLFPQRKNLKDSAKTDRGEIAVGLFIKALLEVCGSISQCPCCGSKSISGRTDQRLQFNNASAFMFSLMNIIIVYIQFIRQWIKLQSENEKYLYQLIFLSSCKWQMLWILVVQTAKSLPVRDHPASCSG